MDNLHVFMFRINLHLAKQRANCKNNDPQLIFTLNIFIPFSSVSIVHFEQVNVIDGPVQ